MAKSRYEYVKNYEIPDPTLLNTYMVVRIDGKGFTRFCEVHGLHKPNDIRLLSLMTKAAKQVMQEFKDIMLAYGQSDEYSFVFRKSAKAYNRRGSKILSTVVSLFSTAFVYYWPNYFSPPLLKPEHRLSAIESLEKEMVDLWEKKPAAVSLAYPPAFDSRLVVYPSVKELRDYCAWRQADTHINNLYNTCFWKLVLDGGMTPQEANAIVGKTDSAGKNELLFSKFSINYNMVPALYRKGTTLLRVPKAVKSRRGEEIKTNETANDGKNDFIVFEDVDVDPAIKELPGADIISQKFWDTFPFLLED